MSNISNNFYILNTNHNTFGNDFINRNSNSNRSSAGTIVPSTPFSDNYNSYHKTQLENSYITTTPNVNNNNNNNGFQKIPFFEDKEREQCSSSFFINPRRVSLPLMVPPHTTFPLASPLQQHQQQQYFNDYNSGSTGRSGSLNQNDSLYPNYSPTIAKPNTLTTTTTTTRVLDKPKVVLPSIKTIFSELEQKEIAIHNNNTTSNNNNYNLVQGRRNSKHSLVSKRCSFVNINNLNSNEYDESNNNNSANISTITTSEPNPFEKKNENRCSTCHKTFKKPSTLKRHLITHTDSKPFVCTYCGRGFNVKHNLVRHNKRHDEITKQAAVNILVTDD